MFAINLKLISHLFGSQIFLALKRIAVCRCELAYLVNDSARNFKGTNSVNYQAVYSSSISMKYSKVMELI